MGSTLSAAVIRPEWLLRDFAHSHGKPAFPRVGHDSVLLPISVRAGHLTRVVSAYRCRHAGGLDVGLKHKIDTPLSLELGFPSGIPLNNVLGPSRCESPDPGRRGNDESAAVDIDGVEWVEWADLTESERPKGTTEGRTPASRCIARVEELPMPPRCTRAMSSMLSAAIIPAASEEGTFEPAQARRRSAPS